MNKCSVIRMGARGGGDLGCALDSLDVGGLLSVIMFRRCFEATRSKLWPPQPSRRNAVVLWEPSRGLSWTPVTTTTTNSLHEMTLRSSAWRRHRVLEFRS